MTAPDDLRSRLRRQTDHCTARALVLYTPVLRDHVRRSQPPDAVDSYIAVLRNASDRQVGYHNDDLLSYTDALVEMVTDVGAGSEFHGEELLRLFEHLGTELFRAGKSTTDLRLRTARYSSLISNGGSQRKRLIESALRESRTEDERLRALLVMAKYHIDISDYQQAHRYLDECEAVAAIAPTGAAQLFDIHTTRGMVHFYIDRRLASQCLLRGIALEQATIDPIICRATATALHFLGRIHSAQGDFPVALAQIVLAQHYKTYVNVESTQLGYHHLRLGEILSAAGCPEPALWHLEQASRLYHNVRQRSTAEAQLTSALAGLAVRSGDRRRAEYLLTDAINSARRDSYPRGELRFLAQLFGLQLRRGALLAASQTARRAVRLLSTTETGSWRWLTGQARSSTFARSLIRRTRRRKPSTLSCPCPDHDSVSMQELLRRAKLKD